MTLHEFSDIVNARLNKIEKLQLQILVDVAGLKIKAGIWGLLGGAVPIIIGLGIYYLKKGT